jgi:hypothetical protein
MTAASQSLTNEIAHRYIALNALARERPGQQAGASRASPFE